MSFWQCHFGMYTTCHSWDCPDSPQCMVEITACISPSAQSVQSTQLLRSSTASTTSCHGKQKSRLLLYCRLRRVQSPWSFANVQVKTIILLIVSAIVDAPCLHFQQKQRNGADCRVFAIAFAVAICNGQNQEELTFQISKMRHHLSSPLWLLGVQTNQALPSKLKRANLKRANLKRACRTKRTSYAT